MAALAHAPTVVFSGYVVNGKQRIGLLVRSADHGRDASGRMALGSQAFSFVGIGTTFYVDANERFWVANAGQQLLPTSVLKALAGHWVLMPKSAVKGWENSFGSLTDPAKLASGLLSSLTGSAADLKGVHLGPMTKVHGTTARTIVQGSARMAVAATGAPLPLALVGPKGSGDVLTFAYPKGLHITAPKGAITVAQATKDAENQGASASGLSYRASYAHFSADFPAKPQTKEVPASFGSYQMRMYLALAKSNRGPVAVAEEDITPALPSGQVKPALVSALQSFASSSGLSATSQPSATTYRSYKADIAAFPDRGHTILVMSFMANNARLYLLVGPKGSFSALKASLRLTS